jgi:hypothetical protein
MKILRRFLVTLITAGSVAAQAADIPQLENAWYRVEVVIFERTGAVDANSVEVLGLDAPRSFPRGAVAFVEDERTRASAYPLDAATRAESAFPTVTPAPGAAQRKSTPVPIAATPAVPATPTPAQKAAEIVATYETGLHADSFRWQPASTLLLKQEAGRLQRDAAYRVVLHAAWIQPVPDRERPQPLLIQTGERIGNTWRIEGTVDVTLGRYLHVDTRLWYRPDATAAGSEYEEMREQRRMRGGELHYFDHPRFGMLMRIDSVMMPEKVLAQLTAVLGEPVKEPVVPTREDPEAPLTGPARIP